MIKLQLARAQDNFNCKSQEYEALNEEFNKIDLFHRTFLQNQSRNLIDREKLINDVDEITSKLNKELANNQNLLKKNQCLEKELIQVRQEVQQKAQEMQGTLLQIDGQSKDLKKLQQQL